MTPRTQFARLLWKEYRQVRAFWFLLLGCGTALFLAAILFADSTGGLPMIAGVLAILFGVAATATGFSNEHENGTFLFQRCLPTSLRYVAGAKLAIAVVGSLFIFLMLWALILVRLGSAGRLWASDSSLGNEFAEGLSTLVEFLVFGTLLSLIERRPLVGLAKTVALVISIRWIGFMFDFFAFRGFVDVPNFPWPSLTWRFVSLAAGIALIIRVVGKWYADERIRILPNAIDRITRREVATRFQSETVRRGEWRRLFWLQFRVSIWPIAVLTIVGALAAFVSSHIPEYLVVLTVSLMFIGAVAFSAANQNRQALAIYGARSSTIWWSQICFPLIGGLMALGPIVAIIARFAKDNPIWDWEWNAVFCVGIFSGLAAMTWGQLASIRCKSILAAIGYAAGLLIPACLWIACTVGAQAPYWLFVLPVILYPLVESFVRALRWFIEERRIGIWWFVRVGLYLSLALGLIAYRYYEIPGVSQPELDRALSIVPRMNEEQTARFRIVADTLMDREAFEPADVHNQFEIERALRNNQYRWVADHRAMVDEIIDGPWLTSLELQTDKSAYEADWKRLAVMNEFLMAAIEAALHEGDVDLGARIIRKIPIQVAPTDTLRWCKLPKNDSQSIRRLAHQLQDAAIFDRECRRVLLRQTILPNLHRTWGEYFQRSNWFETAATYILTDGMRWNRRARFFTVESVRQLEATLPGFQPEEVFAKLRELDRAKNTPAAPPKQRSQEELPAIYAVSTYRGVLGKLGGMSLQLALVSWQMDHDGRLPNSLDDLTTEYMPKLRFDPMAETNFLFIRERCSVPSEIIHAGIQRAFAYSFGGEYRAIEFPFYVLTADQRLPDRDGRLPPLVFLNRSRSPKINVRDSQQQLANAIWNYGYVAGVIFPLDLPADKPESKDSLNLPTDEATPVK